MTDYLAKLLTERGHKFSTTSEREIVQHIKETQAYVALDFDKESKNYAENEYKLPDGQVIKLGSERFRCAEALFQPELAGLETLGFPEIVFKAVMKADIDIRRVSFVFKCRF